MSDFLTNLVGRSLGTLEVVQPRVPSIYEPYRRGSGLRGARPGMPAQEVSPESAVETGFNGEANTAPIGPQTHKLRTRAASPEARDEKSPEDEPEVKPAEGVEPPDPARPESPTLTPRIVARPEPMAAIQVPSRHDAMTESSASPIFRPATFQPIPPAVNARLGGTSLIAASPRDTLGERPVDIRPLTESQVVAKPGLVRHPRPPEVKTETSSSRMDLSQPTAPRATVEPSVIAHQEPPITSAVHPPVVPSLVPHHHTSLMAAAVRPPVAPRSGGSRNPQALPLSSPSQPTVQVSIGRVEVRALFPEPRARRIQPARPKATVSLDDYLKRGSEGRR
jgi:hypothetical protein